MKQVFSGIAFLLVSLCSVAQELPKNSVFGELLGNGGTYSINYEREVFDKFLGRIGVSYTHDGESGIPVGVIMIGKYFGESKHHFEVDGGVTYINGITSEGNSPYKRRENIVFLTAFMGYRYHKPEGKFLFRIGLTPLYNLKAIDDADEGRFIVSGGVSFGYRF